jgi:hypothetical protein
VLPDRDVLEVTFLKRVDPHLAEKAARFRVVVDALDEEPHPELEVVLVDRGVRVQDDGVELPVHLAELNRRTVIGRDRVLLGQSAFLVVAGRVGVLRSSRTIEARIEAQDLVSVNRAEVRHVCNVLHYLSRMGLDVGGAVHPRRPSFCAELCNCGNVIHGRAAGGIVPHHDHPVALGDRPASDARLGRNLSRVGHVGALTGRIEPPSMKRTANRIALDLATVPEMRAEVRAIRVEDARFSGGRAPNHEVPIEVARRPDLFRLELLAEADDEPTSREPGHHRGRRSTCHAAMIVIQNVASIGTVSRTSLGALNRSGRGL